MSNFSYVFNLTDPSKSSFVVQPYTINGPMTPVNASPLYSNPDTGVIASTANTTLVLVGKGIPEYGEVIQQDMLYMLEHFANATRPQYPTEGQIWYKNTSGSDVNNTTDPTVQGLYLWNGTAWQSVMLSTPAAGGVLDMNYNSIINLANPVNPGDAVNLGTADSRYLALSGGTVTGLTIFSAGLQSNTAPTVPTDVATKAYVDAEIGSLTISGGDYVIKTGDTFIGALNFSATASLLFNTGSGIINFGNRPINGVGNPTFGTDAANRQYVDSSVQQALAGLPPSSQPDGVVISGSLDSTSGVLTLQRSASLADVVVNGAFAPAVHTQPASTVTVDSSQLTAQSVLSTGSANQITVQQALQNVDQFVYSTTLPNYREVFVLPTTGSQYNVLSINQYIPAYNQVQVYVGGIKKYQSFRGTSTITANFGNTQPSGVNAVLGIPPGTYSFTISVDGNTPVSVPITVDATTTLFSLVNLINQSLGMLNIPCAVQYVSFQPASANLVFASNSSGLAASGYQTVTFVNGADLTTSTGFLPTSGLQRVAFTNPVLSTTVTGIPNDATVYTTSITIDGGSPQTVAVTGSACQTFGDLATQITAGLSGATAYISQSGYLIVQSTSTGNTSSVLITQGTLFVTSTIPSFSVIRAALNGTNGVTGNVGCIITVDGTPYNISALASSLVTMTDVRTTINGVLGSNGSASMNNAGDFTIASASVGNLSSVVIDKTTDTLFSSLPSNTLSTSSKPIPGHGDSSVTVSYSPGELFPSISFFPYNFTNNPATYTLDWYETGVIGSPANQVRFTNPLPLGSVVEVTVLK